MVQVQPVISPRDIRGTSRVQLCLPEPPSPTSKALPPGLLMTRATRAKCSNLTAKWAVYM